jgi:biopolymer transport protein ExbB
MLIFKELASGGWVMAPLLVGSICVVAVVLERIYYFARLEWGGEAFLAKLEAMLKQGKQTEVLAWMRTLKGPIPSIVAAAMIHWPKGRNEIESGMGTQAKRTQPALYRAIPLLETAVTASPLVGLLGTILGMMGVFHVVAERLAHNPNADTNGITAGIGEALISTASGIFLAVMSLLFNNLFGFLAEIQMERADLVAADLLLIYDEIHSDEKVARV